MIAQPGIVCEPASACRLRAPRRRRRRGCTPTSASWTRWRSRAPPNHGSGLVDSPRTRTRPCRASTRPTRSSSGSRWRCSSALGSRRSGLSGPPGSGSRSWRRHHFWLDIAAGVGVARSRWRSGLARSPAAELPGLVHAPRCSLGRSCPALDRSPGRNGRTSGASAAPPRLEMAQLSQTSPRRMRSRPPASSSRSRAPLRSSSSTSAGCFFCLGAALFVVGSIWTSLTERSRGAEAAARALRRLHRPSTVDRVGEAFMLGAIALVLMRE